MQIVIRISVLGYRPVDWKWAQLHLKRLVMRHRQFVEHPYLLVPSWVQEIWKSRMILLRCKMIYILVVFAGASLAQFRRKGHIVGAGLLEFIVTRVLRISKLDNDDSDCIQYNGVSSGHDSRAPTLERWQADSIYLSDTTQGNYRRTARRYDTGLFGFGYNASSVGIGRDHETDEGMTGGQMRQCGDVKCEGAWMVEMWRQWQYRSWRE